MQNVDEYLSTRRGFLATAGTAMAAPLAGCSDGGSEADGETGPSSEGGVEETTVEQTESPTPSATEEPTEQTTELYEENNEAKGEKRFENFLDSGGLYWIEMENPDEQISDEIDQEEYPGLSIINERLDDETIAFYMSWKEAPEDECISYCEEPGETIYISLAHVKDWDGNTDSIESGDDRINTDIEGFIDENISGVDDASESTVEDYREILP